MSTDHDEPEQTMSGWSAPPLPPINSYAVISLVAALIGLFPIAIVFGVLAFTRPAGRGLAVAGLTLGVLELGALLIALFGFTTALTDDPTNNASAYETAATTSVVDSRQLTTSTTPAVTTTLLPPAIATTTTEQQAPTVAVGDYCTERDAQAQTSDSQTAYCSRLAGTDAYVWSLTAGVAPNPALSEVLTPATPSEPTGGLKPGDDCADPTATATDSDGRTIYCNPTVNGRNAGNLVWQILP